MGAHMNVNNLIQSQQPAAHLATLPQLGRPDKAPAPESGGPQDTVGADGAQRASDQFSAMMYHSQMSRMSLSVQFQQARAKVNGDNGEAAAAAQQMQFDFFAESRTEQVVAFNNRTGQVAEGRPAGQRETFLGASRMVAQRFQMSVRISGQSLEAFAGAAEALGQSPEEVFDKFMTMADEVLSKTDQLFNEAMEMLDAFVKGADDFKEQFNEFLATMQEMGFLKMSGPLGPRMDGLPAGLDQAQQGQAAPQGRNVAQQLRAAGVQMEFEFSFESVKVTMGEGVVQQSDPVTLDLDGDGIELTHHAAGARFDILGDGRQVNTAFVTGGDAFLALDANGNGLIDSGRELFGDQNGARNGFEELRRYDSNEDGRINKDDERFEELLLWADDGDGKTEEGELSSLADRGVREINLGYREIDEITSGGNLLAQDSFFTRTDGSQGRAADSILNFTV
jgi:hypothetical protein